MAGLNQLPDELLGASGVEESNIPLAGEVMVFFKTSEPPFNDLAVRRALVRAVDVPEAISTLGYPVIVAKSPFLISHPGYSKPLAQLTFDKAEAEKILDEAGWRKGAGGIRQKDNQRLSFTLRAQNVSDYTAISNYLRDAWRDIGVQVQVLLEAEADIQGIVSRHDYQALLYGISLGPDPDVFAYWHSSQANRGSTWLNLSEYQSTVADQALELYQPRFLYVVRGQLFNFDQTVLNSPTDRFNNVENWMIREEKTLK